MINNKFTGQFGEWFAYLYFILHGYRVQRNVRLAGVQIDLVVRKRASIRLIEVKTRKFKQDEYRLITTRQINRIKTASKCYLFDNTTCGISIDVFVVYLSPFRVEHLKDVCDIK